MSDPKKNPAEDSPPPAKKQRTNEGGGEEEEAAEAIGINLFESVNSPSLMQHPILRAAIQLTKGHLDRCLSKSYRNADKKKDGDHKSALLGLTGAIQVRASTKSSYGFTDSTGICFDPVLVQFSSSLAASLSSQIVGKNGDRSAYVLSPAQEFMLYAHLAVLQQTFEHELGHRKNHQEKLNDNTYARPTWTPPKAPLFGEAGFSVQAQIRQDHVPAENNTSLSRRPQILELRLAKGEYKVTRRRLGVENNVVGPVGTSTEVTSMRELVDLMNYPKQEEERDCQEIDDKPDFRQAPDRDDEPPGPRRGGGGGDDDDGSGGGDTGGSGGGGRNAYKSITWYKEAKGAMQNAVSEANSFIWNPVRDPDQSETAIDGYDITRDMEENRLSDAEWEANSKLLTKCEVEAVFCGADQQKNRSIFAATESIYVRLTLTNNTNSEVIYQVSRYPFFHRGLLRMFIEGVEEQAIAPGDRDFVYAAILPGASYTFVRQLTDGTSGDWSCLYKTPTKGTYWTQAGLQKGQPEGDVCFGKKFSFSIL